MAVSIKTTLRKIYAYRALDDFVVLYPFYNIYMAAKGLSVLQISTLLILWSVTDLLTNIPAGVLADKYSRKNLLGLGALLKATGFVSWLAFPHYPGFALGFVLWGVGGALTDGTFQALVYDELKAAGQERQYVKVIGRTATYAEVAMLVATTLASAAILLGYGFLFAASIVMVVAAAAVAFSLPETPRFEEAADKRYFSMLRQGIKEALHNRAILAIILLGGFVGAMYGSLEEFDSLVIQSTGVSLSVVSLAMVVITVAAAAASLLAYRFEKLSTRTFMVLLAVSGLALLLAGAMANIGAVGLLIVYVFLIRLLGIVFEGKLQHSISSALRATVTSASGFFLEVLAVVIYFTYGLIADRSGNFGALKVFGAVTAIVGLAYLLLAPRLLAVRFPKD